MNFIPVAFSTFWANTLNLVSNYSSLLERYRIVNDTPAPAPVPTPLSPSLFSMFKPTTTPPARPQTSLEIVLSRINRVTDCGSDRVDEIKVFKQLYNELCVVKDDVDQDKQKNTTMILLGSLIYRYFKLLKEYTPYKLNLWVTTVKTAKVQDCRLFLAIRDALNLDPNTEKGFEQRDLVKLDVTTIVQALEAFRGYMFMKNDTKLIYKSYIPLTKKAENFKESLESMIKIHTERGKPIIRQFQVISFLRSLAMIINNEVIQFDKELLEWSNLFKRNHPVFSKLTIDKIIEYVKQSAGTEFFKTRLIFLLSNNSMREKFEKMDHELLIKELTGCHSNYAGHVLFGGYSLFLRLQSVSNQLKIQLLKATEHNELSEEDLYNGIFFLKAWINPNTDEVIDGIPPISDFLDCEFFGGKDQLWAEILKQEEHFDKASHNIKQVLSPS